MRLLIVDCCCTYMLLSRPMEGFLGYNRYYDTRYVCAADTTHARRFVGVAVSMSEHVRVFKSLSMCLACSAVLLCSDF